MYEQGNSTIGEVARQLLVENIEIVFDCADPTTLGQFWAAVLGYQEDPVPEGYASWDDYDREHGVESNIGWGCFDPAGLKPNLFFQRVPEPKSAKNRVHLDLKVRDIPGTIGRISQLGGRVVQIVEEESGGGWTVMVDPEGNEFCVLGLDEDEGSHP